MLNITTCPRCLMAQSQNDLTDEIHSYVCDWKLFVNQEELDISTSKPFKKGEKMYEDKLIQLVQYSELLVPEDASRDLLLFRANINASMEQELQ